jgi:hypothetical protein
MAKQMKTREELVEIVMREALASGKCDDLENVHVVGPVPRGYARW